MPELYAIGARPKDRLGVVSNLAVPGKTKAA